MDSFDFHFLIVEDHELQRAALEKLLVRMGAKSIHTSGNGAHALKILTDPQARVDIVISDLMMPDVDGIELIPRLVALSTPVALILASTDEISLAAAQAIADAKGVAILGTITKPITEAKLRPLFALHRASRGND